VLTSAAALNDEFQALSYQPVTLANTASTGKSIAMSIVFGG